MPAKLEWHTTLPDVMLITISSPVTLSEVLEMVKQESAQLEAAERLTHSIFDLRENFGVPQQFISSLSEIAGMPAANHPHAGLKILVGPDRLARAVMGVYSRLYRTVHVVDTMEQAEQLIRQHTENAAG